MLGLLNMIKIKNIIVDIHGEIDQADLFTLIHKHL